MSENKVGTYRFVAEPFHCDFKLSTDKLPLGPTIIGMSEVENRRVLEDLLKQPALSDRDVYKRQMLSKAESGWWEKLWMKISNRQTL